MDAEFETLKGWREEFLERAKHAESQQAAGAFAQAAGAFAIAAELRALALDGVPLQR